MSVDPSAMVPVLNDEGAPLFWYDKYTGIEYLYNNADDVYYPKSDPENAGPVYLYGWRPNELDNHNRLIYGSYGAALDNGTPALARVYVNGMWVYQHGAPYNDLVNQYLPDNIKWDVYNTVMNQYDPTYGYYLVDSQYLTMIDPYIPHYNGTSLFDYFMTVGGVGFSILGAFTALDWSVVPPSTDYTTLVDAGDWLTDQVKAAMRGITDAIQQLNPQPSLIKIQTSTLGIRA